ncbi:hypothetical protein HRI_004022800 [Hibiscus trionum]|uniref:SET domain-containing protein n=1 Tax=Hibiscus trionum TaxID=183268 RepID=A0A9W7MN96_HIBTR|nr:hypothetical protein HRI_004022800 [Hibiscus trionum]
MAAVKARAIFLRRRTRAPNLNSDDGLGCDDVRCERCESGDFDPFLLLCRKVPGFVLSAPALSSPNCFRWFKPKLLISSGFKGHPRFTVQANRYIKDLTIITEYVGDVDYLKNRENDDGDSMMTLLHASNPLKSLVICPDKRSKDVRKKQNLKCVRYDVNGECRVLLIANRNIRKGERLYYDYNEYEHEYPTEHFV